MMGATLDGFATPTVTDELTHRGFVALLKLPKSGRNCQSESFVHAFWRHSGANCSTRGSKFLITNVRLKVFQVRLPRVSQPVAVQWS
jgi:hypothetical protein